MKRKEVRIFDRLFIKARGSCHLCEVHQISPCLVLCFLIDCGFALVWANGGRHAILDNHSMKVKFLILNPVDEHFAF